jgi:hypothetical protein
MSRFNYFMDLCGLSDIKHKQGIDTEAFVEDNKLRLIIFSLPDTFRFFLKICIEIKSGKRTRSDFFMPNHEMNHSNLIPLNEAIRYTEDIMRSEGFALSKVKEITEEMRVIAERDMYNRMIREMTMNESEGNKKNKFISFDALMTYLLGLYVAKTLKRVKALQRNFRMYCKSNYHSRMTIQNFQYAVRLTEALNLLTCLAGND